MPATESVDTEWSDDIGRGGPLAPGSGGELLKGHLSTHLRRLVSEDLGVRAADARSVHRMRISARHLRSALKTYGPLLKGGSSQALREELRWLGMALSAARDGYVIRERLERQLAAQPPAEIVGPVARRIETELGAAHQQERREATEALTSARYARLLDDLETLVRVMPVTPLAQERAATVVPRLLGRDVSRLRRAVRAATSAADGPGRERLLHEVRKAAKQLRYAAESAVPVHGARAGSLAGFAERLQENLGDYQDSVVARARLHEMARAAERAGESTFTYGRLHAQEEQRAGEAERAFARNWRRRPRGGLKGWHRA